MKGELRIMNRRGHTTKTWDTEVTEGPLDPEYAKKEFDRLVSEGHLAFVHGEDGEDNVQLRRGEFDPGKHRKVTMFPPFVGG